MNNTTETKKKEKYWIIPILVFITMTLSKTVHLVLLICEFKSDFTNIFFNAIFLICGFAIIPCVILAVILSIKNN